MSNRDHFFALARNIVLRPGGMSPGLEHIVANHTGAFHDTSSFYIYGADHNGEIENLINLITANPSYHTWSSSSNSLIIAKVFNYDVGVYRSYSGISTPSNVAGLFFSMNGSQTDGVLRTGYPFFPQNISKKSKMKAPFKKSPPRRIHKGRSTGGKGFGILRKGISK